MKQTGQQTKPSSEREPDHTDRSADRDESGNGILIRTGNFIQRQVEDHPYLSTVAGVGAAAVLLWGGHEVFDDDEHELPGTTITTTREVERPDGTIERQIDRQFIPAVPKGETNPAPEATSTPETSEIFDAGLIPESLQQKVIPIEQRLHRLALNNNSDTLSELDPEDSNTLKWRGGITFEARDTSGNMMYGLMRNPAVVHETTKYYATAHHEESGELITIEIAHDEGDEIVLTGNEEFNVAFWKLEGAPYSGQLVSAKPMSINENGLETFDNHASLLRGDGNTEDDFMRMATVDLYSNINEASIGQGLKKRIITGRDDEIISRDHRIYESINKENPTELKLD